MYLSLPVLSALKGRADAVQPVVLKRLLSNALKVLAPEPGQTAAALLREGRAKR